MVKAKGTGEMKLPSSSPSGPSPNQEANDIPRIELPFSTPSVTALHPDEMAKGKVPVFFLSPPPPPVA